MDYYNSESSNNEMKAASNKSCKSKVKGKYLNEYWTRIISINGPKPEHFQLYPVQQEVDELIIDPADMILNLSIN